MSSNVIGQQDGEGKYSFTNLDNQYGGKTTCLIHMEEGVVDICAPSFVVSSKTTDMGDGAIVINEDGSVSIPNLLGTAVTAVWGQFSDSTPQALSGTPLDVKFDTVEGGYRVTVTTDSVTGRASRLTVSDTGIYAFTISPQLVHTSGGGGELVSFWAVKNGTAVPRSASRVELANNSRGQLPYLELIIDMNAGDWIQWWFSSSPGTSIELAAYPANGTIPAIPSVIAGVKLLGA